MAVWIGINDEISNTAARIGWPCASSPEVRCTVPIPLGLTGDMQHKEELLVCLSHARGETLIDRGGLWPFRSKIVSEPNQPNGAFLKQASLYTNQDKPPSLNVCTRYMHIVSSKKSIIYKGISFFYFAERVHQTIVCLLKKVAISTALTRTYLSYSICGPH